MCEIVKIVVVGGPGAGKTALIQRHQSGVLLKQYRPSTSPDFSFVHWDEGTQVHLWDVPASEDATGRTPVWYEGAAGFLVVADVTQSINAAADWLTDIKKRMPEHLPVVLLLNKRDLAGGTTAARSAIDHFARSAGIAAFFETSAVEGVGFADALRHVVGLARKPNKTS